MDRPLIVDRYRPLADLGTGGHGSVTLAFDTKMARRVAIKRLPFPQDRFGRPTTRTGLAEARTAALLNHPCIVTVHEWDTDSDEAFIVMEAIDGASVADILDETRAPLDLDEAAAVVDAVAAALEFAHQNGVLHLDLKPANVLVSRDGRVKVADFGVSALTDATGRARGTAGTLGYMPPEQLRGRPLDERTDEWAFASLVYQILTNVNPFDADHPEDALFRAEIAPVPAPSEFAPRLPIGIDQALLTALAPDPEDRYRCVADFADALLDHLGDPDAGRHSLAALVDAFVHDEGGPPTRPSLAQLGVWDRLARYSGGARRVGAAVASAWLMWAGVSAFLSRPPAVLAASALTAVAAVLAPGLGLALGVVAFVAGLWQVAGWLAALVVGVPAVALWALAGRRGDGPSFAPLGAPVLAVAHSSLVMPFLLGFTFEPLPAAGAAAVSSALVMLASGVSSKSAPFLEVSWRFLVDPWDAVRVSAGSVGALAAPGPVATVVAWAVAAALCSIACRRATRTAAVLGAALSLGVLFAGYSAWAALPGSGFALSTLAPEVAGPLAIAAVVIALGAPARPEEWRS